MVQSFLQEQQSFICPFEGGLTYFQVFIFPSPPDISFPVGIVLLFRSIVLCILEFLLLSLAGLGGILSPYVLLILFTILFIIF